MSFREPDVELHLTGWPALIFVASLLLICLDTALRVIGKVVGLL